LFLLGRAAARGVEGDSWAGLLKPFSFCSTTRAVLNSFSFVLPLVFVLLLHLKMMMTVMEGWPTETIFFSFVFPLFFP
jgi:hypothetical protein